MYIGRRTIASTVLCFTFLTVFGTATSAQSQLHGLGSYHSTVRAWGEYSVDLHLLPEGKAFLWWSGDGTWLTVQGDSIRQEPPAATGLERLFWMDDSAWYGGIYQPLKSSLAYTGREYELKICRGIHRTVLDSSNSIDTVGLVFQNGDPGCGENGVVYDFSAIPSKDGVLIYQHTRHAWECTGLTGASLRYELLSWKPGSPIINPLVLSYPAFPDLWPGYFHFILKDLMRIAPAGSDNIIVFRREALRYPTGGELPDSVYQESLSLVRTTDNVVLDACILDTLAGDGLDLTPRVLPMRGNTVDVVRDDQTHTNLMVSRYTMDGVVVLRKEIALNLWHDPGPIDRQTPFFLWRPGTPANIPRMDYDILDLDNGDHVLAYVENTWPNGSRCLVALFDESWNQLGLSRYLTDDAAGVQYNPVLAARGDTIAVAWKCDSSFSYGVSVRFFTRDQVLEARDVPSVPSTMQVSAPWPQPAKERFLVDVQLPQTDHAIVLECRDVLGRLVMRDERSTSTGQLRFSEDVSGMLPGLYLISIRSGDSMELRKLVVE